MAGYTRTDTTNNIATGNVINASDLDNEYDAIQAAYNATTGHTHGGALGEGAPITRVGPVQDVVVSGSAVTPKTDNVMDLGSSSLEFKDLWIDGTANIDSLVADTADINGGTVDGAVIGGSTPAAGTFTTATATTGNITTVNATTVDTTNLEVTAIKAKDGTAAATIADATGVVTIPSAVLTTADINGGTIDGTTIGGASAAAGTFTTATATTGNITTVNATTVNTTNLDLTNLEVTNIKAKDGTASATIADSTGVMTVANAVLTTADINGGTVDGAVIGGASAAAGNFTTLGASGVATFSAGSVSAPAITTTGDTNTGIFFPAADTIAFTEGGVESGRFTSAGALQLNANLTFSGTGNRILGDFSNATQSSRVAFQTSTTNGATSITAIPNGTGTSSAVRVFENSDPTNAAFGDLLVLQGLDVRIRSSVTGTGTNLPLTIHTGGGERLRIDTSGNCGIGTNNPEGRLQTNASGPFNPTIVARSDTSATNWARVDWKNHNVTNTGIIYFDQSSQFVMRNDANGPLIFTTNGDNERMRIDSAGNVGIGTSSPVTGLSVSKSSGFVQLTDGTIDYRSFVWTGNSAAAIGTWSNHALLFNTNNTERMRIDSSGNVGIGTNSPLVPLHVVTTGTGTAMGDNVSTTLRSLASGRASTLQLSDGTTSGYMSMVGGALGFASGGSTERMRIDSSGNLLLNTTTATHSGVTSKCILKSSNDVLGVVTDSGNTQAVRFTNGTTAVGSINLTTSATSYSTSSDYRLKENIAPMTGALGVIQQLKPVTYNWKADGSSGQGFIAHELQAVVPDCVTGEKDAVDKDGKPVYQGIDTSFLVATLTSAIQELKAELDSVKAELQTLKGN